ncbi:MAG: MDR family oxidoreductase [Acetobacteraceae bacterium]
MAFRAILISREGQEQTVSLVELDEKELMAGDVDVAVEYSTVNYKDALAITGRSPIIRRFPLIPGIDLAGTVMAASHPDFRPGDKVVLNGWELGVSHHGGYAEIARVKAEWLIRLPASISTKEAMAIGTAGYTAMLSVLALEHGGVRPEQGDVLVTGASGGVGSVAIALLAKLGFRVLASTGRPAESDYLKALGAAEIIARQTLAAPGKPLGAQRWIGAIDCVGSHTLANVLAETRYHGTVAACGLAQGLDLPGSVAPFILRGVTLAGIDSVNAPKQRRERAWARLATDLDRAKLAAMTTVVGLEEAPDAARRLLAGELRGRTVVDVNA